MALLEFYGDTCPHCISMKPIVAKVEKKLKLKFEKLEVWNDEKNADRLGEIDRGLCGGVPFFYNTESKQFICGSSDEDTLIALAKGEKLG
jgi:thiol-disulfide isomerase/thioredoxin